MRVLAALSGGVDSAVAAARVLDAGHDVVGVHMALTRNRAATRSGSRGCCSIEDASDARWAAEILGIPFYVWDLSEQFEERVVADFLAEYRAGRTPNPCVRCNERVKFDALLERALALGFDAVATGHYARLTGGADGRGRLSPWSGCARSRAQRHVRGILGGADPWDNTGPVHASLSARRVREEEGDPPMTYVIAQPCVDVKDRACVDECPVDCIYEGERTLYINADECVDCGACEPVCPTEAIFYEDDVPEEWDDYTRANIDFFELKGLGSPGGAQKTGPQSYDDPMVAALPPQNDEWKAENGYE